MRVIVDAFGGDKAPLEVLRGCELAKNESGIEIILVGNEPKIRECASQNGIGIENVRIIDAPDVISMDEEPREILKSMKNCSMAVGLRALADGEGDAFVTAGSTGAAVVGATFYVKRIPGIKRAALAAVLPTTSLPCAVVDTGANVDCRPEMLTQFGLMGSIYMKQVTGIDSPKVGLLNIGTEETKGGDLQIEAYRQLKAAPVEFVGNIEAREVPSGACNVLVCDGFSGNIVVKLTEGVAGGMFSMIKDVFMKNLLSKFAAMLVKPGLRELKKRMDYTEYGGAPLLGIAKPVIKSHGNSGAKVLAAAIRQAAKYAQTGVIDQITEQMPQLMTKMQPEEEK